MRSIRNVLFVVIGLLVGAFFPLAHAATKSPIPAEWPSASAYPTGRNGGGAFDCAGTPRGGDLVKFPTWQSHHATRPIGSATPFSRPPYSSQTVGGWTDATTEHACYFYVTTPYCPSGYSWDGADMCLPAEPDQCADNAGKYDNSGDPQPVQLPGQDGIYSGDLKNGKVPPTICIKGCEADPRAGYNYSAAYLADGTYQIQGNPRYSGKICMGTSAGDLPKNVKPVLKNSPEYDCVAKGQGFGYVNGAVMCTGTAKPAEEKAPTKTSTKSNTDGTKIETQKDTKVECDSSGCTTTTTTTTTVINADGSRGPSNTSTDTSKTASGDGGSTVVGGGGGGGNSNGDGKKAESTPFCQENPNSVICKQGSFSGGTCGSEPSCSGDPVQCATARAVWKMECKTPSWGTPTDEGRVIGEKKIGEEIVPITLSGSSSCPSPRSVTVLGHSVSMSFDPVCQFAEGVRPVVILIGWIAAAYIVLGRKTSGGSE